MKINNGFIFLHRQLLDWEWYKNSKMIHLFIHLLLKANHADGKWQGHLIKRGQLITGIKSLSYETGLSIQNIRTCLQKLKLTNEITIQPTNHFSIITVCNYDSYQSNINEDNNQKQRPVTLDQQTTNKQLTTNNKNNKNNKYMGDEDILKIQYTNLRDKILIFFGFNPESPKHHQKTVLVQSCINIQEYLNELEYFKKQAESYIEFKQTSKQEVHSFNNWIGTPDKQFLDGAWNSENWTEKLKKFENKEASSNTVYKKPENVL